MKEVAMYLMSVNIPSKLGESWGQLVLISGKVVCGRRLEVLVWFNCLTLKDREIDDSVSETLQHLLKETHWVNGWVATGVYKTNRPVENTKGSLRSLARKLGKDLDTSVPASVWFAKKPLV